jgi:hypothetical protein
MKVLFVGLARAIWLFDFAAVNPTGKNLQGVIEGIIKKYQFAKGPESIIDLTEKKSLAFNAGSFVNSKGTSVFVGLNIYSDGMVADTTSSTDDANAFLEELIAWMVLEFGLTGPAGVRIGYVSQIDFECELPMSRIDSRLVNFIKLLEAVAKPADRKHRRFDLGALNFWTEDVNNVGAPSVVKFERKIPAPFSVNHYFSQAPVETTVHLTLLEEFERLLSA